MSAVVTSGGGLVEWGKYSSYGVPFGLPGADTDSDGDCDSTDITQIQTWINASTYDVRAVLDLDGDVDSTDKTNAQNNYQGTTLGWNVMSGVRRQHGYAGYEWDAAVSKCHVRNRVLDPHLGRWTRRDPLEYVDGPNLLAYAATRPLSDIDPSGLGVRCEPRLIRCPATAVPGRWASDPYTESDFAGSNGASAFKFTQTASINFDDDDIDVSMSTSLQDFFGLKVTVDHRRNWEMLVNNSYDLEACTIQAAVTPGSDPERIVRGRSSVKQAYKEVEVTSLMDASRHYSNADKNVTVMMYAGSSGIGTYYTQIDGKDWYGTHFEKVPKGTPKSIEFSNYPILGMAFEWTVDPDESPGTTYLNCQP